MDLSTVRAFVTLFVVMNSLPLLPVVMSMTAGRTPQERTRIFNQAFLAGGSVALFMVLAGSVLLDYIYVSLGDLRVGGGLLLLVFAIYELLFSIDRDKRRADSHDIGIVPLGIPILIGPATLTTLMVLSDIDHQGPLVMIAFLSINLLLNWTLVQNAHRLVEWIGSSFSQALGKIYGLLLVAIAVSMLRNGVVDMIRTHFPEMANS